MRGIGAGIRIFDLLNRKPLIDPDVGMDVDPTRRGLIRFEGVAFQYPSRKEVTVLKGLDLEIRPGESVALVYAYLNISVVEELLIAFLQWRQRKWQIVYQRAFTEVL